MTRLIQFYQAQIRASLIELLQYQAQAAIWLIWMILQPAIYLTVWSVVSWSRGGEVAGFSTSELVTYFVGVMVVNHATFSWDFWEFERRVRQGTFAPLLLRPIHPIHVDIAANIAFKFLTLLVMIPASFLFLRVFNGTYHFRGNQLVLAVFAIFLAFFIRFFLEWTIALLAFWTTRTLAINEIYYVTVIFFSGQVAPLKVFPPSIQTGLKFLPFRYLISFPVEIALNRLQPGEIWFGFILQGAWLVIIFLALLITWKSGLSRFTAVGT